MFLLHANKTQLEVRQREAMTSGSVNVYPVRFEFSQDWEGLKRTVTFRSGAESVSVLLEEEELMIPWEVLERADVNLSVGVCGTREGTVVLPTRWASLGTVQEGALPGQESRPPTQELWQQELSAKGDGLSYDGRNLSLLAGDRTLSTVLVEGGGASGAFRAVTCAEYMALSDEEKAADVVYLLTDGVPQ